MNENSSISSPRDFGRIFAEKAELEKALLKLELTYKHDVASIESKLEALAVEASMVEFGHSDELMEALSNFLVSRNSFNVTSVRRFILNSKLYLNSLFNELIKTSIHEDIYRGGLRGSDLQLQDNAYGGDTRVYTAVVQKGYATNYHPNLFSITMAADISQAHISEVLRYLEEIKDISIVSSNSYPSKNAPLLIPAIFAPFFHQTGMIRAFEHANIKVETKTCGDLYLTNWTEK